MYAVLLALSVPFVPSGPQGLAESAVERLLLADAVAAAKLGTGKPITDAARERELLDAVAALSARIGLSPELGTRFFRAQIEAGKAVQRGLHARWRSYGERPPGRRPDLAGEIRPRLDRLTPRLLRRLRQVEPLRANPVRCAAVMDAAGRAAGARAGLDALHRDALRQALVPVCARPWPQSTPSPAPPVSGAARLR
ncbi:gamma subclass chorismate mutase AroQ [Nonomuraea sp. NN258]|uniref:gamma subclass chorismate mutase AroQ n=1 Tax=Nonomuraea antri TaxID=2730852 RepID=UPI00156A30F9|nr:gamma subclass chorismate mutase AroQ [Nonomuraea antri]NRQ34735.1 gamma subclass chorismate mutase AroQ [Nonomuraea antri]